MAWSSAQADDALNGCGPIWGTGHFGPFDYRTQRPKLAVVDQYHFTPRVESLLRGESTELGGDLSYTLKAAPNHHRALIAVARFGEKTKSAQPPFLEYTVECYFDRALRFAPDDTIVRVIYAQYLTKKGRRTEAAQQLDAADTAAEDDGFSHYNIGLMYFEIGDYGKALVQAQRAQALGFDRPDLVDKLKRVNKWQEPAADAAVPGASAAAGAAASAVAPS